jgi:hypothetical protein
MTSCSLLDFYSMVILICPDFPKYQIKKIYLIYSGKNLDPFKEEVDVISFFLLFALCFVHSDHFEEIEKILQYEEDLAGIKYKSVLMKTIVSTKSFFEGSIKEPIIYEVLLSMDEKLIKEHMLNTVTTCEDAQELLNQSSQEISLKLFIEKLLSNYNFIQDFFSLDELVKKIEKKFNMLEQ